MPVFFRRQAAWGDLWVHFTLLPRSVLSLSSPVVNRRHHPPSLVIFFLCPACCQCSRGVRVWALGRELFSSASCFFCPFNSRDERLRGLACFSRACQVTSLFFSLSSDIFRRRSSFLLPVPRHVSVDGFFTSTEFWRSREARLNGGS